MSSQSPRGVEGGEAAVQWVGPPRRRRTSRVVDLRLTRIVARRVASAIVLLLVVSTLSFVLISLTPGDQARAIVGVNASDEQYLQVREQLGLDLALPDQYWRWLSGAVQGDLGMSLMAGQPVADAVQERLGVTAFLIAGSMAISLVLGVLFGVISAVRGGATGRSVDIVSLTGFSVPPFWLAAVLITIFAVKLHWLPATGYVEPSDSVGLWLQSLALPVVALSVGGIAAIAKQARDGMLEGLASEHVRAAWARGISPRSIMFRYALRGAALRVIAVSGWLTISLIGGTVLVESVFALPGIGSLAVSAATQFDIPLVQGVVICFTVIVVIVNLVADVLYMWFDPRMRTQ